MQEQWKTMIKSLLSHLVEVKTALLLGYENWQGNGFNCYAGRACSRSHAMPLDIIQAQAQANPYLWLHLAGMTMKVNSLE